MRFFLRRSKVDRGKVWGLLHTISDIDSSSGIPEGFQHIENIVNSAFSGSLDVDQEDFKLLAYDRVSTKRTKLNKAFYRDLHITTDNDMGDEGRAPSGTVTESRTLSSFEDAFQEIEGTETAEASVIALVALRDRLRIEVGIDPLYSLLSGLEGNLEGSENIINLCNHSEEVRELIVDLLESSKDISKSGDFSLSDVIKSHLD